MRGAGALRLALRAGMLPYLRDGDAVTALALARAGPALRRAVWRHLLGRRARAPLAAALRRRGGGASLALAPTHVLSVEVAAPGGGGHPEERELWRRAARCAAIAAAHRAAPRG